MTRKGRHRAQHPRYPHCAVAPDQCRHVGVGYLHLGSSERTMPSPRQFMEAWTASRDVPHAPSRLRARGRHCRRYVSSTHPLTVRSLSRCVHGKGVLGYATAHCSEGDEIETAPSLSVPLVHMWADAGLLSTGSNEGRNGGGPFPALFTTTIDGPEATGTHTDGNATTPAVSLFASQ